jgi:hypothetical protein
MVQKLKKIASSYKALPDKKRYAEFITAILSIPVLITMLLTNLNSLQAKNDKNEEPKNEKIVVSYVPQQTEKNEEEKTTPEPCKKGIGNIQIVSPSENEEITSDPVTVHIATDDEYCAVVWSYRINDGRWSDFDDKNFSLYNLENGTTRLEVRIKSLTSKEEKTLTRRFTFSGNETPSPTATPSAE